MNQIGAFIKVLASVIQQGTPRNSVANYSSFYIHQPGLED